MKTKKKINIQPKWKIYLIATVLIAVGTTALDGAFLLASYPSAKHREISRQIAELDNKAFTSNGEQTKILESDKYKDLKATTENVYSTRMSIASGVLSVIIGVAIVAAVYRYLRRNFITTKPVGATVLINVLASLLATVPAIYMTQWLSGATMDPLVIILLLAAAPFALALSALMTWVIAKITEWHYNRSHGFTQD